MKIFQEKKFKMNLNSSYQHEMHLIGLK